MDTVASATGATISWDPKAGEDWGTLVHGRDFVAMISISLPLAVTVEADIEDLLHAQGISEVIVVDAYDDASMCCGSQHLAGNGRRLSGEKSAGEDWASFLRDHS